ncbi:hypothetical protein ACP70R_037362 [Stipagrostis hirtigluma subsp. patula]
MVVCKVMLLLALVVSVQPVGSPSDRLPTATSASHLEGSSPAPQPHREDPCGTHPVPCNPAGTGGALAVTILSSIVSAALTLLPIKRVRGLQLRRNEEDTFLWWFLFLGLNGYVLWTIYFCHCFVQGGSALYIVLACTFGAVAHAGLLAVATRRTTTPGGDNRIYLAIVVPLGCCLFAAFLKFKERHYMGWVALGFSVSSHLCRMGSADYRGGFDTLVVAASFAGGINGFLWLTSPQLCLSEEYKINSYIIGVIRSVETFFWFKPKIVRFLWKFEGEIVIAPAPAPAAPAVAPAVPVVAPAAPDVDALAAAPDVDGPAVDAVEVPENVELMPPV